MSTLRRFLAGLALASFVVQPVTAFAGAAPTPTPPAPQRPGPTIRPPTPTSSSPTATPEPAAVPATPTAEPTPQPEPSPTPVPIADDAFSVWHGVVREGGAYRRSAPSSVAEIEEDLDPGTPVRVDRWVGGSMLYPDVITWGEVDPEDGGGYIFGGSLEGVLPPAAPPPPEEMQNSEDTWIDVNLTLNVVTVYEVGLPVKMILTSPGRPGFETQAGRFSVRSKLRSQTMSGPGYVVPGVPSVEYFYGGQALHGRYWTLPDVLSQTSADVNDDGQIQAFDDSPVQAGGINRGVAFGVPSSHGCLGMEVGAAAWLYGLTSLGTPVDVHY